MSGSSYRLQQSRPRPTPSPLVFDNTFKPSSVISSHHDAQTLLYDLPTTVSMSPPTSPRSHPRAISPTSPTYSGRNRGPRSGRPTPPPSARNRSQTPLGVAPSELEQFAAHCRAWYYCQDEDAGRMMTQTLATLPPSQRAPFSRLQASIRSAYHRSINARRHAEFQAHLSATTPGGSLLAHARADPRGNLAIKERYERMERFIHVWCNMGLPGTNPFFESLWAIMRLQVLPQELGGAGKNRIQWEFDDAVFKEAAGKDFMFEAIDFLKGVLAFEERPSSKVLSATFRHKDVSLPVSHSRAQSQPLPSHQKPPPPASNIQPKRARAPSDPFLDAPNSRTTPPSSSPLHSSNTGPPSSFTQPRQQLDIEPPSPGITSDSNTLPLLQDDDFDDDDVDGQYLRVWTSPDLANPEILQLLKLFPPFITRRPLPRFAVSSTAVKQLDIEQGNGDDENENEEGKIRFGTGSMWISSKERTGAWEGGWWTRLVMWWRRIFC